MLSVDCRNGAVTICVMESRNCSKQKRRRGWLVLRDSKSDELLHVSIIDGEPGRNEQPDLVRVKVWNLTAGEIVYDSQPGALDSAEPATALKHGELKVHQPKKK